MVHGRGIPSWDEVRDLLEEAGYDSHIWEVEIERRLMEALIGMSGSVMGENVIEARRAYLNNAQRHAAINLMRQVVIKAIQGYERRDMDERILRDITLAGRTFDLQDLRKVFDQEIEGTKE